MNSLLRNTTALVACLSLVTPHLALAQAAPEVPVEQPPEVAPETPVEAPEQAPAEAPAEAPTEAPAEVPAEAPAETPVEAPSEAPPEVPAEVPAEAPAEAAPEAPPEVPQSAPQEAPAENPSEAPVETPAEVVPEAPASPAEPTGETPAEPPAEVAPEVTPEGTQTPSPSPEAEAAPAAPADTAAETPAETPAEAVPETAPEAEAVPVPEVGVAETEAAREAAGAAEAPAAAALSEEAPAGDVVEETVTEESSRSSAEDFATSLRDALQPAAGAPAAAASADKDDDTKTLSRALLLGLGAVAVGSVLSNNRQVELSAPDRLVVTRPDGSYQVIKDDTAIFRRPGARVSTQNYEDGSTRTIVTRDDGSRVVTIRDADLRVLRRSVIGTDGVERLLIDETQSAAPIDLRRLPPPAVVPERQAAWTEADLRRALDRETRVDRSFTLAQVRDIPQVRALVAPVNVDAITFDTGSAAIRPDQARNLADLGNVLKSMIEANPYEMFLIEGHTDTVGSDAANLALSDRRAESVALVLTEYFDVPPENMVVQGYGEQFLKVRREGDIRENRRASVRRITELLARQGN